MTYFALTLHMISNSDRKVMKTYVYKIQIYLSLAQIFFDEKEDNL